MVNNKFDIFFITKFHYLSLIFLRNLIFKIKIIN